MSVTARRLLLSALALLAVWPAMARADLPAGSFVFDGDVQHLAHDPATGATYVAGSFTQELAPTGSGVVADATTGAVDPSAFAHLSGRVSAAVADGSGGWYVGGNFVVTAFSGHVSLLHLTSVGQIDTSFNPNPTGSFLDPVTALAVSGTTLYVGGGFDSIGGQTRHNLAAIDTASGSVTAWNPNASDQALRLIETLVVSGGRVYIGGGFGSIGGQSRQNLAAVDASTGAVTSWAPTTDQVVTGLAVSGTAAYLSGSFTSVDGTARTGAAAVNTSDGSLRSWDPQLGRTQDAIAVAGGTVYLGASYDEFNDASLHAVDVTTGAVQNWHPSITSVGGIRTLTASGNTLYVGGGFDQMAGASRHNAAAFDVTSGALTAWNPNAGGNVVVLAPGAGKVYVGGAFAGAGAPLASVAHLARLNGSRALDTSFHPVLEASAGTTPNLSAIAARAGTLYVAGNFTSVGGQARQDLAAIDIGSGAVTSWNPGPVTGRVLALAPAGDVLYLGGSSIAVGGQDRGGLAALDTQSGELLPWHPSVSGNSAEVRALVVSGAAVYAGGYFTSVGGASRNALAAIDASSGATTAWNPALASQFGASTFVNAMHLDGSTLYIGGQFDTIGGAARADLGQVDLSSGSATSWQSPGVQGGDIDSVTVIGSVLYVGGTFLYAGGQPVNGLAGFNTDTGGLAWTSPLSGGYVEDLAGASGALLIGGNFGTADDTITGPFASLSISGNPDVPTDVTPPTISISSPSSGQHVAVGARVTPAYTCSDSGSAVVACSGPAALDTATAGTKPYTVTAADTAGNQARRSVTYTVDGPDTPGNGGGSTTPTPPGTDSSPAPSPHPFVPPESNSTPPRVLPAISLPATVRLSALKHGLVLKLSKLKSGSKYTAKLTLRGKLLVSTKGKATAGGGATVRLHFSKAALRKLKHKTSVQVQVLAVAADGSRTTLRRSLRIG